MLYVSFCEDVIRLLFSNMEYISGFFTQIQIKPLGLIPSREKYNFNSSDNNNNNVKKDYFFSQKILG
jgi:hypothetical protein